jgi:DNA repair protein RadC
MSTISVVSLRLVREGRLPYGHEPLTQSRQVHDFIRPLLSDRDREVFVVICLNTRNRPVAINEASIGTINQSLVSTREVFKVALLTNASAIIIAHNHPSGDPAPSHGDRMITDRIKEAGQLMDIHLVDHVIVGDGHYYSFADEGLV